MLVYAADFVDDAYYEREEFVGYEESIDESFRVVWKPIAAFESGDAILYPDGVLDYLS